MYRPWIPGEHCRGICAVECVTAHLRGFEEDSRSEVVFWIDELSIEFGCNSVDWHTLLEEDLVAHLVVLPNHQEDEILLRETLENLGSSPFAKKHVHIELAKEAREGSNAQDRAERLMAPPPRGRDCSPSVEKHVNIVLAIRGPARSLNTQDKDELSAWSSALNRTVDQIVDASIPQPQEESLENLGRSRSAEKYVHIVLAI